MNVFCGESKDRIYVSLHRYKTNNMHQIWEKFPYRIDIVRAVAGSHFILIGSFFVITCVFIFIYFYPMCGYKAAYRN